MKEIEKMKAGLEYCYDDEEVTALKLKAVQNCKIYNSIDDEDLNAQYAFLKEMLGSLRGPSPPALQNCTPDLAHSCTWCKFALSAYWGGDSIQSPCHERPAHPCRHSRGCAHPDPGARLCRCHRR